MANVDYSTQEFWDNHYTENPIPVDWYQKYSSLSPLINLYIPREHRVLTIGCGNSTFSEEMVVDGYTEVVNVDISSVLIEAMQEKYSGWPQLKFLKMDARDMSGFESGSFDAVLDKGTLDSVWFGQALREDCSKMIMEIGRVLKDKGVYILVTSGSPHFRLQTLEETQLWNIKLHVIEREGSSDQSERDLTQPISLDDDATLNALLAKKIVYIYVCTKDESLKEVSKQEDGSLKEVSKQEDGSLKEVSKQEDESLKELSKQEDGSLKEVSKQEDESLKEVSKEDESLKEVSKQEEAVQ